MKKSLESYINYLEKNFKKIKDKEDFEKNLLQQINIFQHERLIHLIVTAFVGIISILILGLSLITENIHLLILFFALLVLFIPYIFHYYFLENGVQKLYEYYWELKK